MSGGTKVNVIYAEKSVWSGRLAGWLDLAKGFLYREGKTEREGLFPLKEGKNKKSTRIWLRFLFLPSFVVDTEIGE